MSVPAKVKPPRCHLPWQEMIIQADGTVEPCCYWTAHGNDNAPLGNVNSASVEEIWNAQPYRDLRRNMAAGNLRAAGCANCFAVKQGQKLGLEYDTDCEKPEHADGPYHQNIATLKSEIAAGAERLEAKPTIVSITASHKCNLTCAHCYQNSSRQRQWSRKDAFSEIEALVPTLVRLIAGGGEPLLLTRWRNFISKFDAAAAPLLNFGMTTNATLVKPEVLEGLKRFKSLHIIVSLDGANSDVYEKIREGGKFAEVEANLFKLQEAVASRPKSDVTTFGLCMSVMKSNITHLPEFIRWAGRNGLLFSIHPVLKMPITESLVSFNDPEREMAGWRSALDEARRLVKTLKSEKLPPLWTEVQKLSGHAAYSSWPFISALEDFIPWDITFSRHYRHSAELPPEVVELGQAKWPRQPLVAGFTPLAGPHWQSNTVPYYARITEDPTVEVSLPLGDFVVQVMPEFDVSQGLDAGICTVSENHLFMTSDRSEYGYAISTILAEGAHFSQASSMNVASSGLEIAGLEAIS